jgi:primosomal replication protein N
MNEIKLDENTVTIVGEARTPFEFDHEIYGERFYKIYLAVARKSGFEDVLPVVVSDKIFDVSLDPIGNLFAVDGTIRSHNLHENGKCRLLIYVFADLFEYTTDTPFNSVCLSGTICKEPVYRKTPLGREIGDVLIASNLNMGKSAYIPTMFWGRNARFVAEMEVGTKLNVTGRFQSREYIKRIGTGEDDVEQRVCYELSVSNFHVEER